MSKKKYVEKATIAILNRIKFHAPIVFDEDVNLKALYAHGVDPSLPIFVFDKNLSRPLVRAFEAAFCEEDFNLLLSKRSVGNLIRLVHKKLPKAIVFDENSSGKFLETVQKLNINYPSSSNYNLNFRERFFKVNEQILNPHFEDFSLRQVEEIENVFADYSEFVLNGSNFFCSLQNRSQFTARAEIELNIPLEKGYYYFKRLSHAIMIENLLSKEKFFLNFVCRNAKFSFSNVDGLENSVFSCVNIKASFCFAPNEENFVFFNFGKSKFYPKNLAQIMRLKKLAWQKCCEIFNLQIKTKNPKFDFFFNKTLPQKIWVNWLNGEVNENLERKYVAYKKLFLKGELESQSRNENEQIKSYGNITEYVTQKDFERKAYDAEREKQHFGETCFKPKGVKEEPCTKENLSSKISTQPKGLTLVNFEKIGLRELGIFNGQYYKKIFIVQGDEKFLKVGRTFFYNICGITQHSLSSSEPISVCFGR